MSYLGLEATVDVGLKVSSLAGTDGHGNDVLGYADPIPLKAYAFRPRNLEAESVEPIAEGNPQRVVTEASLTVPHDWPPVKASDQIVFEGDTYEVIGEPKDRSHGPFNDLWVALTGSMPGKAIKLRRVNP